MGGWLHEDFRAAFLIRLVKFKKWINKFCRENNLFYFYKHRVNIKTIAGVYQKFAMIALPIMR
ncbi:hypothetical protein Lpp126_04548 [Lacticaseibacillus paracasei subsp. paracasei Lpp126]|uniref:Uncharacterized protein n=1 Tax=Lacticaseibacillus paracasei subsp. paracasei Lpp126 TaxID=1256206 RepID=S2S168_LACPA|nr:hypothetical protein Lpp126_04548 [Lacticaseibacillus paracasei subsp. paracasei Lpp126]